MSVAATLLLIDDEPRLRQLLARILQLEGYTVLEAENARAGLKTLERETVLEIDIASFSASIFALTRRNC
jgi:DNA-binding response OmpR family regulator